MSKSKKILSLIFCILILTILIPILLDYLKFSGLGLHLVGWNKNSFLEFYLSRYIFWGALVLSAAIRPISPPTIIAQSIMSSPF